ncbi:putative ABC transport system permease protein [Evansella caseinilytica]|uniref:Putative hemin transport system permease protein HrtB n=1 Tax=Evansella caseinilytica TaxID=1503961 RepID=A0A1H3SM07_9BACI|nr:ABC transporter permease [Evansella caseinilytica]SDZ38149.1 putative ABC transport system permease protein [Evansella caseinilytica]
MFLALKEVGQSKIRYTLISLIMIAILFLVFFITGLANGLSFADSSSLQNLKTDYIVTNEEADGAVINSTLSEDQLKTIEEQLNQQSTPFSLTISAVEDKQGKEVNVAYFSVDTEKYSDIEIIEGKNISELTGNEVIINENIKNHGYELNDIIVDKISDTPMKIAGFSKNQTYTFLPVIYADFDLGMSNIYGDEPSYNAVLYTGEKVDISGFDTLTKNEAVKSIPGYTETQGSLMMMVVFLFIISAFVSTVFFFIITIQKLNQFGILKAVGADTKYIAKSIFIQVILLTTIGLSLSGLAIYGITQLLPGEMPFKISPTLMLGTAGLFLVLNLLGSLLSVYKVAKIDALEAIGRVE